MSTAAAAAPSPWWSVLVSLHNLVGIPPAAAATDPRTVFLVEARLTGQGDHHHHHAGDAGSRFASVSAAASTPARAYVRPTDVAQTAPGFFEVRLDSNSNNSNTPGSEQQHAAVTWRLALPTVEVVVEIKEGRPLGGRRRRGDTDGAVAYRRVALSQPIRVPVRSIVERTKVFTAVVGTRVGQVGLSVCVDPRDTAGYQARLERFLRRHNPQTVALAATVVAAQIPETDTFAKLYRKYGLVDYDRRVRDFFAVYGRGHDDEIPGLLAQWPNREEELMRNLVLDNGPEPRTIDPPTRLRAFLAAYGLDPNGGDTELQRLLESHGGGAASAAAQRRGNDADNQEEEEEEESIRKTERLMAALVARYGPEPDPRTYLFPETAYRSPWAEDEGGHGGALVRPNNNNSSDDNSNNNNVTDERKKEAKVLTWRPADDVSAAGNGPGTTTPPQAAVTPPRRAAPALAPGPQQKRMEEDDDDVGKSPSHPSFAAPTAASSAKVAARGNRGGGNSKAAAPPSPGGGGYRALVQQQQQSRQPVLASRDNVNDDNDDDNVSSSSFPLPLRRRTDGELWEALVATVVRLSPSPSRSAVAASELFYVDGEEGFLALLDAVAAAADDSSALTAASANFTHAERETLLRLWRRRIAAAVREQPVRVGDTYYHAAVAEAAALTSLAPLQMQVTSVTSVYHAEHFRVFAEWGAAAAGADADADDGDSNDGADGRDRDDRKDTGGDYSTGGNHDSSTHNTSAAAAGLRGSNSVSSRTERLALVGDYEDLARVVRFGAAALRGSPGSRVGVAAAGAGGSLNGSRVDNSRNGIHVIADGSVLSRGPPFLSHSAAAATAAAAAAGGCVTFYRQPFRAWRRRTQTCVLICDVALGRLRSAEDDLRAESVETTGIDRAGAPAHSGHRREWDSYSYVDAARGPAVAVRAAQQVLPRLLLQAVVDPTLVPCPAHPSAPVEYYLPAHNVFACGRCVALGEYRHVRRGDVGGSGAGGGLLTLEEAATLARSRLAALARTAAAVADSMDAFESAAREELGGMARAPRRLAAEKEVERIRREAEERVRGVLEALEAAERADTARIRADLEECRAARDRALAVLADLRATAGVAAAVPSALASSSSSAAITATTAAAGVGGGSLSEALAPGGGGGEAVAVGDGSDAVSGAALVAALQRQQQDRELERLIARLRQRLPGASLEMVMPLDEGTGGEEGGGEGKEDEDEGDGGDGSEVARRGNNSQKRNSASAVRAGGGGGGGSAYRAQSGGRAAGTRNSVPSIQKDDRTQSRGRRTAGGGGSGGGHGRRDYGESDEDDNNNSNSAYPYHYPGGADVDTDTQSTDNVAGAVGGSRKVSHRYQNPQQQQPPPPSSSRLAQYMAAAPSNTHSGGYNPHRRGSAGAAHNERESSRAPSVSSVASRGSSVAKPRGKQTTVTEKGRAGAMVSPTPPPPPETLAGGQERKRRTGGNSGGSSSAYANDNNNNNNNDSESGNTSNNNNSTTLARGWQLLRQGDAAGAKAVWQRVAAEAEGSSNAKNSTDVASAKTAAKARAYIAEAVDKDYAQAASWYAQCLALDPADRMTAYNYGVLLEALLGRPAEALRWYQHAAALGDTVAAERAKQLQQVLP